MKLNPLLLFLVLFQVGFAQVVEIRPEVFHEDDKPFYTKFELSSPLRVNQYAGEINPYTGEKEPWFLLDGLSARAGIGTHYDKWVGVGVNVGIDWKANKGLIVAPVFGSLRLSPKVGEDTRITTEIGYGRSLSLTSDKLSGNFQKISLGLEDDDSGLGLYVELCQYGFSKVTPERIGSFSIGLYYIMF